MHSYLVTSLSVVTFLTCACGGPPSEAEIASAKSTVTQALIVSERVAPTLRVLGILPDYSCGEPRRTFAGKVAEKLPVTHPCLTAQHSAISEVQDELVINFDQAGCSIDGLELSGSAKVAFEGGEARLRVSADLTNTSVDGQKLNATVGYGTCGDEQSGWVKAAGDLSTGTAYDLDLSLAARDGLPIIGGTTYIVNGPVHVTHAEGKESVTLTGLTYESGEYLPKAGSIEISTSKGGKVRAEFSETLWLGKAKITVDDHAPVTVPLAK